jgi:D-alanyl-D-alanine carboxypeptidase (penicillin-binding protein 5/6)
LIRKQASGKCCIALSSVALASVALASVLRVFALGSTFDARRTCLDRHQVAHSFFLARIRFLARFGSAALLACLAAACFAALDGARAQELKTSSPHVFLMDAATGSILYAKGADDPVAPAATAKIMTAELVMRALTQGKLHLADTLHVSENAWRTGGAPSRGTAMFAAVNSNVSVEDLLRGLTVVSGNDAAIALAEGLAGSEAGFAEMMTARAKELGLPHLVFHGVWGKDEPGQGVTAREMAELAAHIVATYPDLYKLYAEKDLTWNKVHQLNRNPLLTLGLGADGLSTGFVKGAGFDVVASAVQNGRRLILAIYGAQSSKEREEDAQKVFGWGFGAFEARTLFAEGEIIGYAAVYGGALEHVPLIADGPLNILLSRKAGDPLTAHILYDGPVPAPIEKGARIGKLEVKRGSEVVANAPLRAAEAVAIGSLPRRAMDAGLELGIDMFRKYVLKD